MYPEWLNQKWTALNAGVNILITHWGCNGTHVSCSVDPDVSLSTVNEHLINFVWITQQNTWFAHAKQHRQRLQGARHNPSLAACWTSILFWYPPKSLLHQLPKTSQTRNLVHPFFHYIVPAFPFRFTLYCIRATCRCHFFMFSSSHTIWKSSQVIT